MRIIWMTWKDREHPAAGGAEVINEAIAERLCRDGHEVIFCVGGFVGAATEVSRNGFKIVRLGGRVSVYWKVYQWYRQSMQGKEDLVIDEINTIPFFASWYSKTKTMLFIHQLAREIWFYEMPFPLSFIGYIAEWVYLRLLSNNKVITVSESTKKDLMRFGFKEQYIHIISEGIDIEPITNLVDVQKFASPTMLALGTIRSMKRTDHIVRAFEIAKKSMPALKLIVAGKAEGRYGANVLKSLSDSRYASDIEYLGAVSKEKKVELLQKSHVFCVASVKEGWGLVVSEAASQGTPSVVYEVDGLRDSVKDGITGSVCRINSPEVLASQVVSLLTHEDTYRKMQQAGVEASAELTFERAYKDFCAAVYV